MNLYAYSVDDFHNTQYAAKDTLRIGVRLVWAGL